MEKREINYLVASALDDLRRMDKELKEGTKNGYMILTDDAFDKLSKGELRNSYLTRLDGATITINVPQSDWDKWCAWAFGHESVGDSDDENKRLHWNLNHSDELPWSESFSKEELEEFQRKAKELYNAQTMGNKE